MTDSPNTHPAHQSRKGSAPDSDPGPDALAALARLLGRSAARTWLAQAEGDGPETGQSDPGSPVPKETEE